jgi:hydrogenase expression/formation protein HypD
VKYVEEFRDVEVGHRLAAAIAAEARPERVYRIMEFCGGHTHALCRYGLPSILPPNVEMVHGPGCPVCVLPIARLEQAIFLAREHKVTLCTFGDLMRVPAKGRSSLMRARAEGADVRMVLGSADALSVAEKDPGREVVFFAIGFETTTPPTAAAVKRARELGLGNFSALVNHVLTPPAIQAILDAREVKIDGIIGPGHVSTIIGSAPYEPFARDHHLPIVVSGFEPLDMLQSILMIVRQLNEGRAEVENEFSRGVTREGNRKAQALVAEVLTLRESFAWRGLGTMPKSALRLRDEFAAWDAEKRWSLPEEDIPDHPACACARVIRGLQKPTECAIFGTACTPETPLGSCMVSPEGSCAAYYLYRRAGG